ncbi:MAG: DegT/DnrJ/EryC1/StrS family aminotransferase [Thermoanaerobaculia bacterium]
MSEDRIPLAVPCLEGNTLRYLQECVETNFVSSVGPFVDRFESEFAAHVGSPHAVACANGTAALHVALCVAGVGPGDEVIVSDFTFVATVNPIAYVGASPVLADSDWKTWNIDPDLIVEELDGRARAGRRMPKAVLVAHVLGLPVDIAPIAAACDRHGVALIEDAAEALGARYSGGGLGGKQVGTVGVLGCYSFNGNKIITSGGGGMITTTDASIARRAKHLTTQAKLPGAEYFHDTIGFNYRMPNLNAALGVAQLEMLDDFIQRKLEIATRYDDALADMPGITLPPRPSWSTPSMWLYSILIDSAIARRDRKVVHKLLASEGIDTRPVWAPAHMMPFYAGARRLGGAVAETLFERGLSLPCSVTLGRAEQDRVIGALRTVIGR